MQLFVTSECPIESARALDDARVVNQCRETAQLICTALLDFGVSVPYRPTHPHHPVTKWVASDHDHLGWAVDHLRALRDEHLHRFPGSAEHRSAALVLPVACDFLDRSMTGMPDLFQNSARNDDLGLDFTHLPVFDAYRAYLSARWLTASRAPRWTRRVAPSWHDPDRRDGACATTPASACSCGPTLSTGRTAGTAPPT